MSLVRFKNNDGVSCYMVSILHILQQIPCFTKFINSINCNKSQLIYSLNKTINYSLQFNGSISVNPMTFKKHIAKINSMWGEMEHQDTQEFLIFLITILEKECGIKKIVLTKQPEMNLLNFLACNYIIKSECNDYSELKEIFNGYLLSLLTCKYCKTNSPCFESFITLPLSIPLTNNKQVYTLEECMDNFVNIEQLDENNKVLCSICMKQNRAYKMIKLWKTPKILVIQLKRFILNMYGMPISKITNPVIFPIDTFDITDYFHVESPYKINSNYSLIGINLHHEFRSINAGHYTSIAKYNNKWYLFDDDNNVQELNNIQNNNAYLLFYIRNN